jgi:hydroxymethylglutaryl-CoA lyase
VYRQVCEAARKDGVRVRAYLSTAFGCPFEGAVPPSRVAGLSARLIEMGAFEVSVSDTIGVAHPGQVPEVVEAVASRIDRGRIALHFHDTQGLALVNVLTALDLGIATFDASAGGLGGCPYAPGAAGNLATEELVYMLNGLGIETGVNLDALADASSFIESKVGRALPSRLVQARRARTST